jgi:hypothetical protein
LGEVTQEELKEVNDKSVEKFETYKKSMQDHEKQLNKLTKLEEENPLNEDDQLTLNQKKELNSYFELWKTGQNSASD